MANFIVGCLGLLWAAAAADNQRCGNTAENQTCDGGAADEASLLAHNMIKKQRALATTASAGAGMGTGTGAAGGHGDSRRLEDEWRGGSQVPPVVASAGFCCWYSPSASCNDCTAPSGNECDGPCGPEDCTAEPNVGGPGFWCPSSPSPSPTPSPTPPSPSPTPPSPTPSDTLEACLSASGGSPWTYVGSQVNENPATGIAKNIHNARVTNSINPSAVVFAQKESEVVHAVSCAYKFNKPVYGRSGMNQYEASCADEEGGGAGCVLIDTNNMMQLEWASTGCQGGTSGCMAKMGPGLSLGAAYVKLSDRSYALPAGTCAQVRVAGLTLGGGKGWLTRKYGLTLDRLRGIDAVLLNGTQVYASEDSEPHLFWLARGGGGNLFPGVVTAFHFEVVPMPQSPLTASRSWNWWDTSSSCRQQVFKNWYEKLAIDSDLDLFARITIQNFGSPEIRIDMYYYGSDKQGALNKLNSVNPAGCPQGQGGDTWDNSWIGIVLGANGGNNPTPQDLEKNNCGWSLETDGAGKAIFPKHTDCYGWNTEFNLYWAYRSLVFGKGYSVPDSVWNTLANVDAGTANFYVELDPSNGATAQVASDATAYPWRDPGYVTLQQNMRGDSAQIVQTEMDKSAAMMRNLTADVPKKGYYNYLDKNMESSYGAVPRDTYYGENADTVESYLKEYTEGISPNGCARCTSWELKKP